MGGFLTGPFELVFAEVSYFLGNLWHRDDEVTESLGSMLIVNASKEQCHVN